MSTNPSSYDAVVVGASIAGSTAATLLARQGRRVALVEKHADADAYKTVCTHFIQACATPTIKRLGIDGAIEDAGGIRNWGSLWTRYGWVEGRPPGVGGKTVHGYSIRRSKLDPIVRDMAAGTPGVELLAGRTVVELMENGGAVAGVVARSRDGRLRRLGAPLVVAADGRSSTVARLARVPARTKPHGRIAYFAYYENLPVRTGEGSLMWLSDPDAAYAFPMDDGITLLAAMPSKERLPEFRADAVAALERTYEGLPDAPDFAAGRRISKVLGRVDMTNTYRFRSRRGLAFVGDAAMAADPLWGVGCGWAFTSAEWLADALAAESDRERALKAYRRRHRSVLLDQHLLLSDYATGRPFGPPEKLIYAAAARDEGLAERMSAYGERRITGRQFLTPATLGRAAWVLARRRSPAQTEAVAA